MKKILLALCIIISVNVFGQEGTVNLTLRSQDWAWLIGRIGSGNDSAERQAVRNVRTQILAANPPTWNTNVQITGIKEKHIVRMYLEYNRASFGEMMNLGATNAERTTIYNNIRALVNTYIQTQITVIDNSWTTEFTNNRSQGKSIVLDN